MSCNGCRVLRKGCSEDCMLRHCLEGIDNPQAQANATVFVTKFFGRAGLMSFISSVPRNQRPSLFHSLFFEAVGRAVNPTAGVVGLLWSGNWHQCQTAVTNVLRGGTIEFQPLESDAKTLGPDLASFSQCTRFTPRGLNVGSGSSRSGLKSTLKRNRSDEDDVAKRGLNDLDISLIIRQEKGLAETPSEESETTTFASEVGCDNGGFQGGESQLLRLFI
ncbi:hypothetical protein K2173_023917 [Erythroxylum novogranatense]|uniref:LOB domain-containing protein n=1 Tax=Erythroxylum novogranatense TaxID=1862640 RepID=A0AAV8TPM6_9ROSI|nr:hypothetical protein K2173_023917 [Erythroxylum novogranatense]